MYRSAFKKNPSRESDRIPSKKDSIELYTKVKIKSIELKQRLEQINDLQTSIPLFYKIRSSEATETKSKSVLRKKQPIIVETLSVDKWLYSKHKKPADELPRAKSYNSVFTKYHATGRSFPNSQDTLDESYTILNSFRSRNSNYKFNMKDVNTLNKIEKKLNSDLNNNVEIIRRINIQNEFNSVVAQVKFFLGELEKFNEKSTFHYSNFPSLTSLRQSQINLYKYDFLL